METILTFPKDVLRLLYWIYFKPFTLRRYVKELDPKLDETLKLWQAGPETWTKRAWRELTLLTLALYLLTPLILIFILGLLIQGLTGSFEWRGAMLWTGGCTLGMVAIQTALVPWREGVEEWGWRLFFIASFLSLFLSLGAFWLQGSPETLNAWVVRPLVGLAGSPDILETIGIVGVGMASGVGIGMAGGMVLGVAGNVAMGVAVGVIVGAVLGMAGDIGDGVAMGVAVGVLAGVALREALLVIMVTVVLIGMTFGVAFGVAFGVSIIVVYFHLWAYVIELPAALLLSGLARAWPEKAQRYLHFSPVYWDEFIWLPLLGLDKHLVAVCQQDRQAGAEEIAHVAQSFRQRWAARNALVELAALEMEDARDVESMARMAEGLAWLPPELPAELEVVLPAVHQVGQRVKAVQESETIWNKRENLVRTLREIQSILKGWGLSPQAKVAMRFGPILKNWQKLLAREEEALAQQQAQEGLVPNFYVVGSPLVTGSQVFKGRRDLFLALERALTGPAEQRPTLLLYGQRRSGKTSVLHQFPVRLGPDCIPVFVDMQSAANAESATGLLHSLSRAIIEAARDLRRLRLPDLSREELAVDPYIAFQEDWLAQVERVLGQRVVLLNLDEYERLEEMLQDGRIDRRILNLLRNLTQHHPQLVVLFSGSHIPQDMPAYWADYLIGVQLLQVGYLEEAEARELIESPIPNFPLHYEEAAVERILRATRGQPFLVQATCQRLVDLVNRERRQHATLADAEAALQALVAADDTLYWRELWAGRDSDDAQRAVLLSLARHPDGAVDEATLADQVERETLEKALPRLLCRDILERTDDGYRFQVELMRRWVQQYGTSSLHLGNEQKGPP